MVELIFWWVLVCLIKLHCRDVPEKFRLPPCLCFASVSRDNNDGVTKKAPQEMRTLKNTETVLFFFRRRKGEGHKQVGRLLQQNLD